MRLKLIISYDGTPFSGWQSQPNGNAIQDLLEAAFLRIVGSRTVVHGAGRTDAGVHALGQCAHVDVPEERLSVTDWCRALNAHLPREIRVLKTRKVGAHFHARFSAQGKIYRYRIWNAEILPPLEINRAWHIPRNLDFDILCSNALLFEGKHDFSAFSANRGKKSAHLETSERTIRRVQALRYTHSDIHLIFEGEGFLYKMVRMLTGALVRVAQGKEDPGWIPRLLSHTYQVNKTSYVAPAQGLYLVKVVYDKKGVISA